VCTGKFSASEWFQIHSFGNPVPHKSQHHQHSDKLLPHAVLHHNPQPWPAGEVRLDGQRSSFQKKKKVLISWDTRLHSLDHRPSVTSARLTDHGKVRSQHSSVAITLHSNHCLQMKESINPNASEHSYVTSGHFNHSS